VTRPTARVRALLVGCAWLAVALLQLAAFTASTVHVVAETNDCCHECCGGGHDEGPVPADPPHDCGDCALCRVASSPPLPVVLPAPVFVPVAVERAVPRAPEVRDCQPQRRLAPARGPPDSAPV
jgi:hypothetical protein